MTAVPGTDDEYLWIDVEGIQAPDGVVYLGFRGRSWRVWEFHPFSVAFAGRHGEESPRVAGRTAEKYAGEGEKESEKRRGGGGRSWRQ